MKLKHLIYSIIFTLALSSISCQKQTCPTYATSGQTKRKKPKKKSKKNAPWHKKGAMKKGKNTGGVAPAK